MKTRRFPRIPLIIVSALLALRGALGDPVAPDDFLGLKWGITKQEVQAAMKAKNTRVMPNYTTETHLSFGEGVAAGFPVDVWECFVSGDKFWRGIITFKSDDPDGLFKQVKKMLTEKYGTRQRETFKEDPAAEWTLTNAATKEQVSIRLSLHGRNKQRKLALEYVNDTLKKTVPIEPPGGHSTGAGF
jgi:hypothetical protein